MNEIILASAFTMGLMGAGHCAGMCGGIASALSIGRNGVRTRSGLGMLPIVSAYNIGRLTSYTVAGALFGWFGSLGWSLVTPDNAIQYSRILGIGFMVVLGLYLLGWWQGLTRLEALGSKVWRHIEPYGRRFLPIKYPHQAAILGMLWGWLPCGMVYTGLAWALASGGALQGAYIMLAFGAGTLPMLIALGISSGWLTRWTQHRRVRQFAGITLLLLAGYLLVNGHSPAHQSSAGEAPPEIHSM